MLSVSGARGIVGRAMTPTVAAEFAAAFGSLVRSRRREEGSDDAPEICVGSDGRPSGPMLAAAAMSGLLASGCRVVDLGVVTTPTVGVMVVERGAAAGLVITASHNPLEWNGIKCLTREGAAPDAGEAREIIRRFREREIEYAPVLDLAAIERDDTAHRIHVDRVLAVVDPEPIRRRRLRVVLDSVNGAGCVPGRMLLEELGCTVVHVNGEPTGRFSRAPEPLERNLVDLAAAVPVAGADCGFAQDPDADRLAVIDERGRYIGEEYTLVLAARRLLDLGGGGVVIATNLSTSRMIDDLAARYPGTSVVRTAVGEANVAAAMREAGAPIGGEGNGGVILPAVGWVRDSLAAMALVLSLLAAEEEPRPLGAMVDEMPRYCMIKSTVDVPGADDPAALASMMDAVAARFSAGAARIDRTDGVRVDLAGGWVHLRASNTEPIVRIIAEADDPAEAEALIEKIRRGLPSP